MASQNDGTNTPGGSGTRVSHSHPGFHPGRPNGFWGGAGLHSANKVVTKADPDASGNFNSERTRVKVEIKEEPSENGNGGGMTTLATASATDMKSQNQLGSVVVRKKKKRKKKSKVNHQNNNLSVQTVYKYGQQFGNAGYLPLNWTFGMTQASYQNNWLFKSQYWNFLSSNDCRGHVPAWFGKKRKNRFPNPCSKKMHIAGTSKGVGVASCEGPLQEDSDNDVMILSEPEEDTRKVIETITLYDSDAEHEKLVDSDPIETGREAIPLGEEQKTKCSVDTEVSQNSSEVQQTEEGFGAVEELPEPQEPSEAPPEVPVDENSELKKKRATSCGEQTAAVTAQSQAQNSETSEVVKAFQENSGTNLELDGSSTEGNNDVTALTNSQADFCSKDGDSNYLEPGKAS
ncbi:hypothetical protein RUM43_008146 [Polyplax serrata]|uniref:Uncharacterized protein n=1 Tax=Polyplax serrata TaxID=468196 RepID=A0AAN8SAB3_POLSC